MALIVFVLAALLAAVLFWVLGSLSRRLRRATVLVTAHEQLHQRLLKEAVHHADIDPFAQTVLEHLRRHTTQTTQMKGLT